MAYPTINQLTRLLDKASDAVEYLDSLPPWPDRGVDVEVLRDELREVVDGVLDSLIENSLGEAE